MKHYLHKRWPPLIIWLLIIFLAASNPTPLFGLEKAMAGVALVGIPLDRLLSALIRIFTYQILSFLITRALIWKNEGQVLHLSLVFISTLIFAMSIESYQILVTNNQFAYFNILMAGWGTLLGILAYLIWHSPKFNNRTEQEPPEQDLLL